MARIIHVEDDSEWIKFARKALADHTVDSANTYIEALLLIRDNPPYDLALVDLNLERNVDRLGGEILDVLKADYPTTRRIVVTGQPPAGGLRDNLFERYGLDDVIIKGEATLPGIRRIVAGALRRNPVSPRGVDRKSVMVIYGHDQQANAALFDWLRAIGLQPQEWGQLVKQSQTTAPYIGQVLEYAFGIAQAVVVFFTPDEYVVETTAPAALPASWRFQARPNVLIEAGMALALHPDRTVLLLLGPQELPSDIAGRHYIKLNGTALPLHELADRLEASGCEIDRTGSQWLDPHRFPDRDGVAPWPSETPPPLSA